MTSSLVYARAFFDLQLQFAKAIWAPSGLPLTRALLEYTNLYVRFGLGRAFDPAHPVWQEYLAGMGDANDTGEWTYRFYLARPPAGDSGAVAELAKLLVTAENPVLMGGQAIRTPEGMKLLIELAETLQAPVSGGKFPSRHPLNQAAGGVVRNADLIVGLEVADFWGTVNNVRDQLERSTRPVIKKDTKLVSITAKPSVRCVKL